MNLKLNDTMFSLSVSLSHMGICPPEDLSKDAEKLVCDIEAALVEPTRQDKQK